MVKLSRRDLLLSSLSGGAAIVVSGGVVEAIARSASRPGPSQMKLGLVTYQWGKDWDVPTLIGHCEQTGLLGVELRTTHKHGVEPDLSARQRLAVRQQFDNSPVSLVGIGSNENFDSPDPGTLKKAIEATKKFITLSHDVGGTGVKVKPNRFHEGVPHEKTIEQIGKSLNLLAEYGQGYGQQIRLEVHGQCSPLPIIKQIMDIADHPNVAVCWNCNSQDLGGEGLDYNFNLVKDRFGDTAHIRELDIGSYPYQSLMNLFVQMNYSGWILLEARTKPNDRVGAMHGQHRVFSTMLAKAHQQKESSPEGSVKITKGKETVRVEFDHQ
ncbi:MAG: TIM barrel protein [Planctomycetes bacterium]|nr:TIM barrel protein [Planctomycetota bacterium]